MPRNRNGRVRIVDHQQVQSEHSGDGRKAPNAVCLWDEPMGQLRANQESVRCRHLSDIGLQDQWKDRARSKHMAKPASYSRSEKVYTSVIEDKALEHLVEFRETSGKRHPYYIKSWGKTGIFWVPSLYILRKFGKSYTWPISSMTSTTSSARSSRTSPVSPMMIPFVRCSISPTGKFSSTGPPDVETWISF